MSFKSNSNRKLRKATNRFLCYPSASNFARFSYYGSSHSRRKKKRH